MRPTEAGPARRRETTYGLAELCEYLRYSASRWERQVLSGLGRNEYQVLYVLARHELRYGEPLSHHTLHKVTGLRHEAVGRAARSLCALGLVDCWQDAERQHWCRISPVYLAE